MCVRAWLGRGLGVGLAMAACSAGCKRTATKAPEGTAPPQQTAQAGSGMGDDKIAETVRAFEARRRYPTLTPAILASIPDDKIEQALLDHVADVKVKRDTDREYEIVMRLSPGFRMMVSTWWLEAEVNNGGFNQFFWNSSGRFAREAADSFRLIGAKEHGALMEEAIAVFAKEKATQERFKQKRTLQAFSDSYKESRLGELDERFYKLSENVPKLRIAYVRAHPADFRSGD